MKKGVVGIVLVAILLIASYFATGFVIENRLKREVALANQSPNMKLSIDDYDKGFFSSSANMTLSLHIPEQEMAADDGSTTMVPSQDVKIEAPLAIHHGPIIFAKDAPMFAMGFASTTIQLPDDIVKKLKEVVAVNESLPELKLSFAVSYGMSSSIQVKIPAFELVTKDNKGTINWLGLESNFHFSSDLEKVEGDTVISGINIKGPKGDATIGKLESTYNATQVLGGLWVGYGDFTFPSLEVTQNGQKLVQLSNFEIKSNSNIDDGLFDQTVDISLGKIVIDGKEYGPGELKLAVRKLDAKVMVELNKQIQALSQVDEQQRPMMAFSLLAELPKLFAHGASFDISKMNFVLPQGMIDASLHVSVPAGENTNPMMLMKQVVAKANLQAPKSIVKQLAGNYIMQQMARQQMMQHVIAEQMKKQQQSGDNQTQQTTTDQPVQLSPSEIKQKAEAVVEAQLSQVLQAGIVTQDNDNYKVDAELKDGQFMLNGKPFNPAMFRQ